MVRDRRYTNYDANMFIVGIKCICAMKKQGVQTPWYCASICCFKDLKAFPADFYLATPLVAPRPGWDKRAYLSSAFVKMSVTTSSHWGESCQFGQIQGL